MSGGRRGLRWTTDLITRTLLATAPAYLAGLLALIAFSESSRSANARVVGAAFTVTLAGLVLWGRPSRARPQDRAATTPTEATSAPLSWSLAAGALAISLLVTYPRLSEFGRLILGNTGDSGLSIYLLEWQVHAAVHDVGSYFDPNIFAPEEFTLFWGPSLIPLAPVYGAAKLVTQSLIASFNLLMVLATVATLVATYLFLRRAGFGQVVGGLGALLFATTAQRIAHLSHLDSFQTLWIPIFGLLILKVWNQDRVRSGALLGLALGLALFSAPYYFLSGLALVGSMVAIHLPNWKQIPFRALSSGAVTCMLLGGPVLLVTKLGGLTRSQDEVFPINWADFYHPGAFIPALRWLEAAAGRLGGGQTIENWLFPSLVLVLLASWGSWVWIRARRGGSCPLPDEHPAALPPLLAAAALSGIVMALGPYVDVGGRRLPLPMSAIMMLPGFDSARVTGRFIAPAFLALTVVCSIGMRSLFLSIRPGSRAATACLLAVLTLATVQPFYPAVPLDVSGSPTQVNRELASRTAGRVVELPWPGCPGYGCLFTEPPRMIWSRFDWFPRLGGYSGYIPDYWSQAHEALAGFPDTRSFELLDRFDVRYLILRVSAGEQGEHFDPQTAGAVAQRAASFRQVSKVERFGEDYLVVLR